MKKFTIAEFLAASPKISGGIYDFEGMKALRHQDFLESTINVDPGSRYEIKGVLKLALNSNEKFSFFWVSEVLPSDLPLAPEERFDECDPKRLLMAAKALSKPEKIFLDTFLLSNAPDACVEESLGFVSKDGEELEYCEAVYTLSKAVPWKLEMAKLIAAHPEYLETLKSLEAEALTVEAA